MFVYRLLTLEIEMLQVRGHMYVQSLAVERPIPTLVIDSSTLVLTRLTSLTSARYQAVQNGTLTQALYANMSRHIVIFHPEQPLQIMTR